MFTELLQTEVWRRKLELAGFRVITEPWQRSQPPLIRRDDGERDTLPRISRSPA